MTGLDDIVLNSFNQCCRNIGDNKTTTGTGRVSAQPDEIDLKLTQADFRRNVEREDRLRVYDARGQPPCPTSDANCAMAASVAEIVSIDRSGIVGRPILSDVASS